MIATTFDYIVDLHLLMVIILERAIAMLKVVAPAAANLALPDWLADRKWAKRWIVGEAEASLVSETSLSTWKLPS